MKIIKEEQTEVFEKPSFRAVEYPLGDKDINIGRVIINGRYPEEGVTANTECKEILYVLDGVGTLHTETEDIPLAKETAVLILPKEKYFITGENLDMLIPCTPEWTPKQQEASIQF